MSGCALLGCTLFIALVGLVSLLIYWPVGLVLLAIAALLFLVYASTDSKPAIERVTTVGPTTMPSNPTDSSGGGLIGFYGLKDWWLTEFSAAERQYMTLKYAPPGATLGCLSVGSVTSCSLRVDVFLNSLAGWFPGADGITIRKRIFDQIAAVMITNKEDQAGDYQGRHYTTYVEDIKQLSRDGDLDQEEKELLGIIKTMERKAGKTETVKMNFGPDIVYAETVAPWYYWRLAIPYRKKKDYASEIAIIERHFSVPHAEGARAQKLRERLPKAQALLQKQRASASDQVEEDKPVC